RGRGEAGDGRSEPPRAGCVGERSCSRSSRKWDIVRQGRSAPRWDWSYECDAMAGCRLFGGREGESKKKDAATTGRQGWPTSRAKVTEMAKWQTGLQSVESCGPVMVRSDLVWSRLVWPEPEPESEPAPAERGLGGLAQT
ncbi:hypothetical protein CT0861_01289, partial [Colletotrichum tofieldiae]